jgi:hypothetical protein
MSNPDLTYNFLSKRESGTSLHVIAKWLGLSFLRNSTCRSSLDAFFFRMS